MQYNNRATENQEVISDKRKTNRMQISDKLMWAASHASILMKRQAFNDRYLENRQKPGHLCALARPKSHSIGHRQANPTRSFYKYGHGIPFKFQAIVTAKALPHMCILLQPCTCSRIVLESWLAAANTTSKWVHQHSNLRNNQKKIPCIPLEI